MRSFIGKIFLLAALLGHLTAPCRGEDPFATLSISPETVQPGANVSLEVVLLNPATDTVSFATPAEISASLIVGDRRWPVVLHQQRSDRGEIGPGAFSRRSYVLRLPADAYGLGVLEIEDPLPLRGAIDIARPPRPAVAVVEPPAPPPAPVPPPPDLASTGNAASAGSSEAKAKRERDREGLLPRSAASHVERAFRDHFSAHEPVYFIYGGSAPQAKFQLSFKYRIVGDSGGDSDHTKNSMQFGYSQRSLWDFQATSSPFFDTSYMPEFFYEYLTPDSPGEASHITFLGFQTGYGHESNGRDGLSSRSLNTLFFRPAVALGLLDGWRVIVAPRIFNYIFDLNDNPEMKKFRGFGELRVLVGKNEGPELALTGRTGSGWEHTTYQADLTVPLRSKTSNFASYFLLQYFDGYGESLITYRNKSSVLRAGFSFVR
jgi:phospholipase A1/A2